MNYIVQLKNVSYTYPESKEPAVKNINLNIQTGSWTTIIGHNGSGKSTITRLINGLLVADKNPDTKIIVDGRELNENNVWNIRDEVGIVFQNPDNQFVGATVADDVAFGLENRGVPRDEMLKRVKQAIHQVGMDDFSEAEPANLSGGQKQRVAIAGILAIKPKVIIFDEATSMLDPNGREQILTLVKKIKEQNNLTVISITHDIDQANLADQVIIINDGQVLDQNKPDQVFKNVALIKKIGLEEPFIFKLKNKLIEAGIKIPASVTTSKKMVKFLCRLNSKM